MTVLRERRADRSAPHRAAVSRPPRRQRDHHHQRARLRPHDPRCHPPPPGLQGSARTSSTPRSTAPSIIRRRHRSEEGESRLYEIAETGKYGQGRFVKSGTALTAAIDMADSAFKRAGHLSASPPASPTSTARWAACRSRTSSSSPGVRRWARPRSSPTSPTTWRGTTARPGNPDGTDEVIDGAVVGFFSLEMSSEQLATRILAEQAEIGSRRSAAA